MREEKRGGVEAGKRAVGKPPLLRRTPRRPARCTLAGSSCGPHTTATGTHGVNDDERNVKDLPPWRLWPEREHALAALADTRAELAVRLCRWPLSLADLSRRSGVTTFTLCRLRSQAAQDWPTYRRLDDLADAAVTIKLARRYARLRADLRAIDERAAAEAQRLRAEGLGWKRINAALGAPPGADTGWVRVLLVRRERSAGRTSSAAGTAGVSNPSSEKGPKP